MYYIFSLPAYVEGDKNSFLLFIFYISFNFLQYTIITKCKHIKFIVLDRTRKS